MVITPVMIRPTVQTLMVAITVRVILDTKEMDLTAQVSTINIIEVMDNIFVQILMNVRKHHAIWTHCAMILMEASCVLVILDTAGMEPTVKVN